MDEPMFSFAEVVLLVSFLICTGGFTSYQAYMAGYHQGRSDGLDEGYNMGWRRE